MSTQKNVSEAQAAIRKANREKYLRDMADGKVQRGQVIPDKKKAANKSKARGKVARNRAMSEALYYD